MKIKTKWIWFFTAIYALLGFIAIRKFLFSPGILGHNWDWAIPYLPSQFEYLSYRSNFVWNEIGLGAPIPAWGISSIICGKIIGLLGLIGLSGCVISKGLVWLTMVLSGFFMSILIYSILDESKGFNSYSVNFGAFVGGLFYGFSPYLFCEFIGGAMAQFSTYAFVPLAIFLVRRYILYGDTKTLFYSGSVLLVLGFSLNRVLLTFIVLVLYICIAIPYRHKILGRLILVWIVYFLFSLYWLIPSIVQLKYAIGKAVPQELVFFEWNIKEAVPSLLQIFVGTGYNRPFFNYVVRLYPIWIIVVYIMIAYIFYNTLRSKNKEVLYWIGLFLCSLVFATGGNPPLGGLVLWFYRNFPLMNLFRSPQHFILIPTLCIGILVGYGVGFGSQRLTRIRWIYCSIVCIALFIWLHPFFLYGDMGTSRLMKFFRGGNYIDCYQLSPGYKEVENILNQNKETNRMSPLPMSGSPYYLATEYQNEGQGGDPFVINSPQPALISDLVYGRSKSFLSFLERAITDDRDLSLIDNLINLTSAKYILFRKDVLPNFGYSSGRWNRKKIERLLQDMVATHRIKEVFNKDYVRLFKYEGGLPIIYIPDLAVDVNGGIETFEAISYLSFLDRNQFPVYIFHDMEYTEGIKQDVNILESGMHLEKSEVLEANVISFGEGGDPFRNFILSKPGKYIVTAKLSPKVKEIKKKKTGWRFKFQVRGMEDWEFRANNVSWSKQIDKAGGFRYDLFFNGDDKQDEYLQMKYKKIKVNLTKYPLIGLLYRIENPDVQTIQIVVGIDFDDDSVPDGYIEEFYPKPASEDWDMVMYNVYDRAKKLYPNRKKYMAVLLELYPHKLWGVDCSSHNLGLYRFWINDIGFYSVSAQDRLFKRDVAVDIKFTKENYLVRTEWDSLRTLKRFDKGRMVISLERGVRIIIPVGGISIRKFPTINIGYMVNKKNVSSVECILNFKKVTDEKETQVVNIPITYLPLFNELNYYEFNAYEMLNKIISEPDLFLIDSVELWVKPNEFSNVISEVDNLLISLDRLQMYREDLFPLGYEFKSPFLELDNRENFQINQRINDRDIILQNEIDIKAGLHNLRNLLNIGDVLRLDWVIFEPVGDRMASVGLDMRFTKINPTRYKIYIQKPISYFMLVFNQTYDPGWKLFMKEEGSYRWKEIGSHFIANSYANGWGISLPCEGIKDELELRIEYMPQKYFFIGYMGSLFSMVSLAVVILVYKRFVTTHPNK